MKCLLFILLLGFSSTNGQQVTIGGLDFSQETPVEIRLSRPLAPGRFYELKDQAGNRIPAQLKDSVSLIFIPTRKIRRDELVTYNIVQVSGKPATSSVRLRKKNNGWLVQINGKPVFFYHVKPAMPPKDSPSYYQRSGFIHPLYSPGGQILTDDFPVAHVHQHAIFSAWTNTRFRNTAVDFWNQHLRTGTVEHKRIVSVHEGPVFAEIITELNHKSFAHGVVLKEQWRLLIYPFSNFFLFDLESVQENITADTLFLNPYHYGGMAFRGSREWNRDDKKNFSGNWQILTSENKKDSSANQTAARWVDASGSINNRPAGVTVFNHESNFRYPQKIRVHPQMPYWCYAPMIDGGFYIAPGQYYKARYRYFVYNEKTSSEKLDEMHAQWIKAPTVNY